MNQIVFQCSTCVVSSDTERGLAELCDCNLLDKSFPPLRYVLLVPFLIVAAVAPFIVMTYQIPT